MAVKPPLAIPALESALGSSTDITYIRMAQGFVYLVAVMDWFSRFGTELVAVVNDGGVDALYSGASQQVRVDPVTCPG